MQLGHFTEAQNCLDECSNSMKSKTSVWNFRYACCISSNKAATIKDLQKALKYLEEAKVCKKSEQIFVNTSKKMLESLGLINFDETLNKEIARVRSLFKDKLCEESKF